MRLNDVNSLSTNCNWVMMMCRKESYVRLVQVSYRLLYQKETSFKAREGATKGDFMGNCSKQVYKDMNIY